MLHSMTGYGSNSFKVQDLEIDIEVKSLNSRYFDSKILIPSAVSTYEPVSYTHLTLPTS